MMLRGRVAHRCIIEEIYTEINDTYGKKIPVP